LGACGDLGATHHHIALAAAAVLRAAAGSGFAVDLADVGLSPEILEPVRREFGVAHCVLDILVPEVVLHPFPSLD
jgi:hypothetical protein